jgi:thiopurine S-methyltransferase
MQHDFWHERWRNGQIGFHTPDAHWALTRHWPTLTALVNESVFVPLCGKSLDMRWLRERGHPVTGVELNALAVQDFYLEWNRQPTPVTSPKHPLAGHKADGITVWHGDFMLFEPEAQSKLFYDRAALIALPPDMRVNYIAQLRRCLADGAQGLLVTLEYDQNQKNGPPFSVTFDEINSFNGFKAEPLERQDALSENPKFQQAGLSSLQETVYRMTAV